MTLAHQRRGAGEPLVLVHGIGSRADAWGPAAERVAEQREVISVDTAGFGGSAAEPLPSPASIVGFAESYRRFFDEIGLDRPHIAGNSMGGGIALELARVGAVRSVTCFSPVGFGRRLSKAWEGALLRGAYEAAKLGQRQSPDGGPTGWRLALGRPPSFLLSFGRPFSVPAEELRSGTEALAAADGFLDSLPYVRSYRLAEPEALREIPLTIAWGRRDVLLNWRIQSRRARRALPWARHVDLPGCGHVPFFDDPQRCAEILLEGSRG